MSKEMKLLTDETEHTDVYKIEKSFIHYCKYSDNRKLTK